MLVLNLLFFFGLCTDAQSFSTLRNGPPGPSENSEGNGVPVRLAFHVQPTSTSEGNFMDAVVEVHILDANDNLVTNYDRHIQLTSTGGFGFYGVNNINAYQDNLFSPISGYNLIVWAEGGIARFHDIRYIGTGIFSLFATDGTLAPVVSSSHIITPSVAGPPVKMSFHRPPVDIEQGQRVEPDIQVLIQDAQDNIVLNYDRHLELRYSGLIGLHGTNNISGGDLLFNPTPSVNVISKSQNGIATFRDVYFSELGTDLFLIVSDGDILGSAISSSFNVTPQPGPPAKLVFSVQPSNSVLGQTMAVDVEVRILDANDLLVTNADRHIQLMYTGGTGLYGTNNILPSQDLTFTPVPGFNVISWAEGGIATFRDLYITNLGSGFIFYAQDADGFFAISDPFDVTESAATQPSKLAFSTQPTPTDEGVVMTPAIQVQILDDDNNLVLGADRHIEVTYSGVTGLNGTNTINNSENNPFTAISGENIIVYTQDGIGTISDLSIDHAGFNYTLTASDGGTLNSAVSDAFDISVAIGPPVKLAFTIQPSNTDQLAIMAPQVQVSVLDANDNLVTDDDRHIELTYTGGNGLLGTNDINSNQDNLFTPESGTNIIAYTQAGVATFSNLSITKPGVSFSLIATDGGALTNGVSAAFEIYDVVAPVFTSLTAVDFMENNSGISYIAVATDDNSVTYGLGSGNDESLFNIDSSTGAVTFNSIPDFENPHDSNLDNDYVIEVLASDGFQSSSQLVTITILDVDEIPPVLQVHIPADNASSVAHNTSITLTFDEDIALSNGTIQIIDLDDGSGSLTINTASAGSEALVNQNVLTIDPSVNLEGKTNYAVQISSTAITDLFGNHFAGIGDNTTFNFQVQEPVAAFLTASTTGDESIANVDLPVELSFVNGADVTVDYTVSGTASGSDYTLDSGTLLIPAGDMSGNISIANIVDDAMDEIDETIIISISNPSNASLGAIQSHTYTILDNDPLPTLAFSTSSSSGSESVTSPELQVLLSSASGKTVTVEYTVAGTADGSDHSLVNGTLTITPGIGDSKISIMGIVDDLLDEMNETVSVTLTNPVNATLGGNQTHTYTIIDDDATPTISFNTTSGVGAESIASIDLQVDLSAVSGQNIAVNYTLSGTAEAADYTKVDGTLNIPAGNTGGTISISNIIDDVLDEHNETIIVTVSNPVNTLIGANSAHTYTITDNDPTPSVSFAVGNSSGSEAVSSAVLQALLSAESGKSIVVNYSVSGTASSEEFSLSNGSITIAPGNVSGNIRIDEIVDDAVDEFNETVIVTLTSPSNAFLGNILSHTYTIIDNDPVPSVGFVSTSATGSESVSSKDLSVALSAVSSKTVTVSYSVSGTASNADHTFSNGTLTFPAGTSNRTISIANIIDDVIDETNETIIVTLTNSSNATIGANQAFTYIITDNDPIPTLGFASTTSSGTESAGLANLLVSLSAPSGRNITVNYTFSGTASAVDFNKVNGVLTIPAGGSSGIVPIIGIQDDVLDEFNETIIVTLSNPGNVVLNGNTAHTYTILDNDTAPSISFNSNASSGEESVSSAVLPLSISAASGKNISVSYTVSGTASNSDFTLNNGTLSIPAGSTNSNVIIADIVDDNLVESDETVFVTLTNPVNASSGDHMSHTYTIINDDVPLPPKNAQNFVGTINCQNVNGLTINRSDPEIKFSWNHAEDPSGVIRYQVRVQEVGSVVVDADIINYPGNSHEMNLNGLTDGSSYKVLIRSEHNTAGWSEYALGGTFTVDLDLTDHVNPSTVSNASAKIDNQHVQGLTVTQDNPIIDYAWGSATDNFSGIDSYEMVVTDESDNVVNSELVDCTENSGSLQIVGIMDDANYNVAIRAIDGSGNEGEFVHIGTFQTALPCINCWSDPATWFPNSIPMPGDSIIIEAGKEVTLDTDINLRNLTVKGILRAKPHEELDISLRFLLVEGPGALFEVGSSSTDRFQGKCTITLRGASNDEDVMDMGTKFVGARDQGTIRLHGKDVKSWSQLGANVSQGSSTITLKEKVNWSQGDEIVIVSSRFDWNQAEQRTIASVNNNVVTLTAPLTYAHKGIEVPYSNGAQSWTADLRAEVGLLSHNIKIQGDSQSDAEGFGGHMMIHDNASAYVDGVELYKMGQKRLMGRYPFHWHRLGDGDGQYFKNSSVHISWNRAITLHATSNTIVENNFFYDHIGHGVFLEDGVEVNNIIRKNVVLLTRRPDSNQGLTPSENIVNELQNQSPASFWITNPKNTIEDNVAAGTQGTGFWFAFPRGPMGMSFDDDLYMDSIPAFQEDLTSFKRNTAHSCENGFDIFDQLTTAHDLVPNGSWNNNNEHLIEDCTWYVNKMALYTGHGNDGPTDNLIFRNNILISNINSIMLASSSVVESSVIVARSTEQLIGGNAELHAYRVYDGPGKLTNNHFIGWNDEKASFLNYIGAAVKQNNHFFEGNTTDHSGTVRIDYPTFDLALPPSLLDENNFDIGNPSLWSHVLRDIDGGISGAPNTTIISDHPFQSVGDNEEFQPSNWTGALRTSRRYVLSMLIYDGNSSVPNIVVSRVDANNSTGRVYYDPPGRVHQLPFIVNDDFDYIYQFEELPTGKLVKMRMDDAAVGDTYMAIFKEFGKLNNIRVKAPQQGISIRSFGNLNNLRNANESGYYLHPNGDLYIKPVAQAYSQDYTITWNGTMNLAVIDTDGDGVSDGDEVANGTHPFLDAFILSSEFNVDNDFEGWDRFNIDPAIVDNRVLAGTGTGDAQIRKTSFGFDDEDVPQISVRMKSSQNNITTRMFFSTSASPGYSTSKSVPQTYTGNGEFQVLEFDMSANSNWNGIITNLRFDPVTANNATFEIDWIRSTNSAAKPSYFMEESPGPEEEVIEAGVVLYPNPFENLLNIAFDKAGSYEIVRMLDLQGRIMQEIEIDPNSKTLEWSFDDQVLPNGIYLIEFVGKEHTKRFRVIR